MSRPLRLGTRSSPLALAQSRLVAEALNHLRTEQYEGIEQETREEIRQRFGEEIQVEIVPLVTRGDRHRGPLPEVGGKGLFTRELEEGLLEGTLDLAVHSLKDLPVSLPPGLAVAAFPERGDPRDALVSDTAASLAEMPSGSVLLTGSLRRQAQILARRPDLRVEGVRGNVGTRLEAWRQGHASGLVLAAAGLDRLGLEDVPAHLLEPGIMLPAPGQGTLAVETRAGGAAEELCRLLDHRPTAEAAAAERRLVEIFGGDCALPLAAWARHGDDGRLRLSALLATPDGHQMARGEAEQAAGETPEEVAETCAAALREDGAEEILAWMR